MALLLKALRFLVLAFLTVFLLQAAIFWSGLYLYVLSPDSIQGKMKYILQFENARPPSGKREVLLIGDSGMEWGFWTGLFERQHPDAAIKTIMAAVPSADVAWYYYELGQLDPHHNRYAAIVVPLRGYKAVPKCCDPRNRYESAEVWVSLLDRNLYHDLLTTFRDPSIRARALWLQLFTARAFSNDAQDLFLHPVHRVLMLINRYGTGPNWWHDEPGKDRDVVGLEINKEGQVYHYPAWFDVLDKNDADFIRPDPSDGRRTSEAQTAFYRFWISRIINEYRNSPTQLIFLAYPRFALPVPARIPLPEAQDIRTLVPKTANSLWLAEDTFENLERPNTFEDLLHLNNVGRRLFTAQLGQILIALSGHTAPERRQTE